MTGIGNGMINSYEQVLILISFAYSLWLLGYTICVYFFLNTQKRQFCRNKVYLVGLLKKFKESCVIAAIDSDILLQIRLNFWVIAAGRIVQILQFCMKNQFLQ